MIHSNLVLPSRENERFQFMLIMCTEDRKSQSLFFVRFDFLCAHYFAIIAEIVSIGGWTCSHEMSHIWEDELPHLPRYRVSDFLSTQRFLRSLFLVGLRENFWKMWCSPKNSFTMQPPQPILEVEDPEHSAHSGRLEFVNASVKDVPMPWCT